MAAYLISDSSRHSELMASEGVVGDVPSKPGLRHAQLADSSLAAS